MDKILETFFKTAIKDLKGNYFQDFVNKLLLKKYKSNYNAVKQYHDLGCDGIINHDTIVAVYAPETHNLKDFEDKVDDDYVKYQNNWKEKYSKWLFIYNKEFTAKCITKLDHVHFGGERWDINSIILELDNLSWYDQRDIASYLGIDEQYFFQDKIRNVIEDILKMGLPTNNFELKSPDYLEDKIKLNYVDELDIEAALNEYKELGPEIRKVESFLKVYDTIEIKQIKAKILGQYKKYKGEYKNRFENLIQFFSQHNINDDTYSYYVRLILLYCFEICLIGRKTQSEENN